MITKSFFSHIRSEQFSKQNTISPLWIDWGAVASKRERSSGVRIMWFFFRELCCQELQAKHPLLPWKNRVINFPSLTQGGPKNHVVCAKGQLISKANFHVLIWTKKGMKLFFDICPRSNKEIKVSHLICTYNMIRCLHFLIQHIFRD